MCSPGQKYDLWMHIDAAYAGSACICPEFRYLLDGVEVTFNQNTSSSVWIISLIPPLWPVGVFNLWQKQLNHIKGTIGLTLVLMHIGTLNGYQLLCESHTVLEPHRGTAGVFYFTLYRPFPLFLFNVFVTIVSPIYFLGCLYSLLTI